MLYPLFGLNCFYCIYNTKINIFENEKETHKHNIHIEALKEYMQTYSSIYLKPTMVTLYTEERNKRTFVYITFASGLFILRFDSELKNRCK